MFQKRGLVCLVSIFALVFSVSLVSAQTEGIPLQKDVFLGAPIIGPEDLPEEITFTLFDAQDALIPLGSQTFTRGQYTVDFEFSQSNGLSAGSVARVKANFTNPLNLIDDFGEPIKPKALWSGLEVAGAEVGPRTKVSDETMVQLLLNSNASMATYLTLAYEGDDNPLTTIYKSLPLSFSSSDGSTTSLSNYFSSLPESRDFGDTLRWNDAGATGVWTAGPVGIGTNAPADLVELQGTNPYIGTDASAGNPGFKFRESGVEKWRIDYSPGDNLLRFLMGLTIAPLVLTDAGKVGIGTTMPQDYLEIEGPNAYIRVDASAGNPGYKFSTMGSEKWRVDYLAANSYLRFLFGGFRPVLALTDSGGVGIGTTNVGSYKLAVEGNIGCRELTVTNAAWADFVFEDNYRLPPLSEVEQFISENKHLPGIPTEAEVRENGVSVGNVSSKLLQKIEELTLYVIDIKKENDNLRARLASMETQLKEIKN